MGWRFVLAMAVGKLLIRTGRRFGRCTDLPGRVALLVDPGFFGELDIRGKVLAVTGSNGKTTTANLVAHILRENGGWVANNAEGSNMTGGVATALLSAADRRGCVDADFVVLEVDERYLRVVFRSFRPELLLVTNLFRDQPTRNGDVDLVFGYLEKGIHPDTTLVLNAHDPISCRLAPRNPRLYYAMERAAGEAPPPSLTQDARACPACLGPLKYRFRHYNHIRSFFCPACGYKSPGALVTAIPADDGTFLCGGYRIRSAVPGLFYPLNAAGALTLCAAAGIPLEEGAGAASTFCPAPSRYAEFTFRGRGGALLLSKNQNPVSYDQSLLIAQAAPGPKTCLFYVGNINHTGNRDTTWLYDVDFELLAKQDVWAVCAGARAKDLAVRLKLAGYPPGRVLLAEPLSRLPQELEQTQGEIRLFSEVYDTGKILEVLRDGE